MDLLAAAGGFPGAAFGTLVAFVFTGFAVIVDVAALGRAEPEFLNNSGFGASFGPQLSFAAGGAVGYAARRSWIASGPGIAAPLISHSGPGVLLVGAGFGMYGHLVAQLITVVPWVTASAFLLKVGVSPVSAVLVGAVLGGLIARAGEVFSRFWANPGKHPQRPASESNLATDHPRPHHHLPLRRLSLLKEHMPCPTQPSW